MKANTKLDFCKRCIYSKQHCNALLTKIDTCAIKLLELTFSNFKGQKRTILYKGKNSLLFSLAISQEDFFVCYEQKVKGLREI